jgi:hypothetical protein
VTEAAVKAKGFRPDGSVLITLGELAARLAGLGMADAEAKVRQAADTAYADPAAASRVLAEAASLVRLRAPEGVKVTRVRLAAHGR